ncbi:MAG TPA: DUF2167 domain-containing protein, partial [Terricaulis sp.]|nr:DUF2167 domain-containing protein [Terricaulis sp.]
RAQQNRPFEGFIVAPAFEPGAPSLAWAERAARPGAQGADLRHESKALGRYGVATLTSIGSADQLNEIAAAARIGHAADRQRGISNAVCSIAAM